MKAPFFRIAVFALLSVFVSGPAFAQAGTAEAPIAQTLVREGDFAVKLANALKLSTTSDDSTAESTLAAVGIAPKNGWIADYPVTPDISGELQASISSAADSGKLPMSRDAALASLQDVLSGYDLPVKAGGAQESVEPSEENYPDATVINNYYYNEGPPVVTYYAPPPDYAYLYTWVPYPFWWANFWYPGYYCLADFDVVVYHHHHREFVSNHYREPGTDRFVRVDPTSRAEGRYFTRGERNLSPSATRGAQSILRRSVSRAGTSSEYRGYGVTRPATGTRSSAFQRWGSSRFEGDASTRGFQSRSSAGQIPSRNIAPQRSAPRSFTPQTRGGFSGFHGSGGFIRGGGGFGGGAPRGGGGGAPRGGGGGGGFRR